MGIKTGTRGRPKSLKPYKNENGVYLFYLPVKLNGTITQGSKQAISTKTKSVKVARERIKLMVEMHRLLTDQNEVC